MRVHDLPPGAVINDPPGKGRHLWSVKLDLDAVREIRSLADAQRLNVHQAARELGVDRHTIRDVAKRRSWVWLA